MCGIAGFWDRGDKDPRQLHPTLRRMTATLSHRGPDAGNVWVDGSVGIGLGHRRLSIIDLSPAGAQPMTSSCGRCVISYNGEIYNASDLADELRQAGATFRGHSDTEVLVEGCARWGVAQTVERCVGMFAFALWDREQRTLTLARDRLGIKPMYWGLIGGLFLFGSELKALRAHPGWQPTLDREALAAYLRFAYVPAPHSIYRGVRKLAPGHLLTLRPGGDPEISRYWHLRSIAAQGQRSSHRLTDEELITRLHDLLRDAVSSRMVADVPLGALLSGGIDSSLVTALMQEASNRPVKTFSIGFAEKRYNEAPYAAAVANHLGTDHHELAVTPAEAQGVIPSLPEWYDEPFADSSQIPTYLVSRLARSKLTVALSGDGGDEVFAGYNRYAWIRRLWAASRSIPHGLRRSCASLLCTLPPRTWDLAASPLPRRLRPPQVGDKLHKLALLASCDSPEGMYGRLVSHFQAPAEVLPGVLEPPTPLCDQSLEQDLPGLVARLQFLDMTTYLPDDILTKVDRASMAISLEVRVPLLDHRVVELAWSIPASTQIRGRKGKWPLRQVLRRYVPDHLIERPKAGFAVPLDMWLRGPLREWAESLIGAERLHREGILEAAPIRRYWDEHQSGQRNWQYLIWNILMFQAWHERWLSSSTQPPQAEARVAG